MQVRDFISLPEEIVITFDFAQKPGKRIIGNFRGADNPLRLYGVCFNICSNNDKASLPSSPIAGGDESFQDPCFGY